MIIPVRCFSCGKPLAQLFEKFKEDLDKGETPKKALDNAGLERYCCRAVFLGHVELVDLAAEFKKS